MTSERTQEKRSFFVAMLLVVLFILAMCTGCSTTAVPVKYQFPVADPVMMEPAPALVPLKPDTVALDQMIQNTAENYARYHELTQRLELWQKWYIKQKEIFVSAQ